MNRTTFISSIGAASAVAFLREVALGDAIGGRFSTVPLVETILPVGAHRFPDITAPMVSDRMESLYHLSESPQFEGSLAMFMQPALFLKPDTTLYAAEQSTIPHVDLPEIAMADEQAYRLAKLPKSKDFTAFTPDQRAAYLRLWSSSAFNARRRFYQSVRFLTFAAFYSMPHVWPVIGYAGPVLQGVH